MPDGKDCICNAYGQSECACGADWTPQEIYDLRDKVTELQSIVNLCIRHRIATKNYLKEANSGSLHNKKDIDRWAKAQVIMQHHGIELQQRLDYEVAKIKNESKK